MRFLILSDIFSLESWLINDREPEIMPAVYEFFNYLGSSSEHSFIGYIFHKSVKKTVSFKNGSEIRILPLAFSQQYIRKFFSLFAMHGVGKKALRDERFDVVYGMGVYSTIAGQLGRRFNLPSVSRIFGSVANQVLRDKKHLKLYTRHILQYGELKYPADLIVCTEDGTQFDSALDKINPGKDVHMLYNGINPTLKKELLSIPPINTIIRSQKINLFSIGRLTQWKRHDLAIRTAYELKQLGLDIQLTILGKGEEHRQLTNLLEKLNLGDEVMIKSPIRHRAIPQFLRQQHIGLFLYDISNMGNAFWESCLSGRLIVTRLNGKINDVFPSGSSTIIESSDPKEIASLIEKHLDVPIDDEVKLFRNKIDNLILNWDQRFKHELRLVESHFEDSLHLKKLL